MIIFLARGEFDLSIGEAAEPPITVFLFVLQIVTEGCMFRRSGDSKDFGDYTSYLLGRYGNKS